MKLTIAVRKCGESVVRLSLYGPLVIGIEAEALSNAFDVLVGKYNEIVVDLANLSRMDARGIGCLVGAYSEGCAKGTRISLCNLPPRVRDLLVIVKLLAVFNSDEMDINKAA
jgi:anti-anti-sigma factor